jgi:hypothetical protein
MEAVNVFDQPFYERFRNSEPEVGGFVGDEEHVLIHDINKAFAKETKAKLDADKTKETLAKSKEAASNARIEAGKKLIEARAKVPEGKWLAWCKDNIAQRGPRDIQRVMKLAEGGDPDVDNKARRERDAAVRHVKSACRIFSKLNLDQKREVISQFQKEVADAEARVADISLRQ